jgi:hypothetical protein
MHRESAQREHGEILEIGRAGSSRRPLGTEIQIEWRSEWQPENNHLKPSGIVDVLKLCRYGWTCKKCSLRANDIKMPDQKQRERPREESAPWTPKEQSPFDGPRTPNVQKPDTSSIIKKLKSIDRD